MGLNEIPSLDDFSLPVRSGVNGGDMRERENEEKGGDESAEQVDPKHHLLASDLVLAEDLVLGRVGRSINGQVDDQQEQSPKAALCCALSVFLALFAERHEHGDSRGDHCDDQVLVSGEFTAVQEDVHDHHWNEFARLSKDHSWVRDV